MLRNPFACTLSICLLFLALFSCRNKLVLNEVTIGRYHYPGNLTPFTAEDSASSLYFKWLFPSLTGPAWRSDTIWNILTDTVPVISFDEEKNLWHSKVRFRNIALWDDGTAITFNDVSFSLKLSVNPFFHNLFDKEQLKQIVSIDSSAEKAFDVYSKSREGIENLFLLPLIPSSLDSQNVIGQIPLQDCLNDSLDDNQKNALLGILNESRKLCAGCGAYFISEQSDSQIVLGRKEKWWGNPLNSWNIYFALYPVKMTYRFYEDHSSALNDLKSGKLDVLDVISAEEKTELLGDHYIRSSFVFYPVPDSNSFVAVHRKFSNAPPYPVPPGYWEGGFAVTFQTY